MAGLVAGCSVDRGGLDVVDAAEAIDAAPLDTMVAVDSTEPDTIVVDGAPLDVREIEVERDAPDSAVSCETGVCDDRDPCTENKCADDGTCAFALYQDNDGDGFQPTGAAPGCSKPLDCDDGNADVFPGQKKYFTFAGDLAEFDYNCDGTPEKRWTGLATCTKEMGVCVAKEGWGDAVPACGVEGTWVTACRAESGGCVASSGVARVQECR